MTNSEMLKELSSGVHVVEFKKSDGSQRKFVCTRDKNIIKVVADTSNIDDTLLEEQLMKSPNHAIPVFVPEIEQWRSFKPDSVISFK